MSAASKRVCVVGAGLSGPRGDSRPSPCGPRRDLLRSRICDRGNVALRERQRPVGRVCVAHHQHLAPAHAVPELPLPEAMTEFPHHSELLAYLERYAEANELGEHITCGAWVDRARPVDGGWEVTVRGARPQTFDALVMASGHYWDPELPELPGHFDGTPAARARLPHAGPLRRPAGGGRRRQPVRARHRCGGRDHRRRTRSCRAARDITSCPGMCSGGRSTSSTRSAACRRPCRSCASCCARCCARAGQRPTAGTSRPQTTPCSKVAGRRLCHPRPSAP